MQLLNCFPLPTSSVWVNITHMWGCAAKLRPQGMLKAPAICSMVRGVSSQHLWKLPLDMTPAEEEKALISEKHCAVLRVPNYSCCYGQLK